MTRAVLSIVLLVSLAHALVHIFELALPSVEQNVAQEYEGTNEAAGKRLSGAMANVWRFPFGAGALLAGWLVDRFGSRRMLAIYLLGCGAMCLAAALVHPLNWLFGVMFAMGTFASIYHPAGLALISHEVEPETLPRALGLHGIFGSLGIGGAPFIAGGILMLTSPPQWRYVYGVLAVPGIALGLVFAVLAIRSSQRIGLPEEGSGKSEDQAARWGAFFTLTLFATLMGFTYAGVLSFLPRYMEGVVDLSSETAAGMKNYLAGGVLLVGCFGQYLAGQFAKRERLEGQLLAITLGNVPGLVILAFAEGYWRVVGALVWSLIHFMHQPIYNSLIAKYTPRARRSLCYGFSFAMGFGLGSFGATFAGLFTNNVLTFLSLTGVVIVAGLFCGILWWWNGRTKHEA